MTKASLHVREQMDGSALRAILLKSIDL